MTVLQQLFEAQVDRTPAARALACGERTLSYAELDQHANRLAHHLMAEGVGPEVLVAIAMERTPEMMIALLAILKAGGAYLPLDPTYPRERLAFMLSDSNSAVLLTQSSLLTTLPTHPRTLSVDRELDVIARASAARPVPRATADNLAYVLYTSGSTGRPKGVAIEHGALTNLLESMRREPGMTADDVMLASTSLSFDIAGLELYVPLIVGATVVLVDRETASDGSRLSQVIAAHGVTAMQHTPSGWRLLLASGFSGPHIKALTGGEKLSNALAAELLRRTASVWNLYGPTETTIWSTLARLTDAEHVTIGRPIANTQTWVLDERGARVPDGDAGELYIGGTGLARGYLNRPELTRERFVDHPFVPGQRLYRTGDLVRQLSDGSLDYLGRIDHQVKVHGYRIELGEIESALGRHPSVREAIVVAREDAPGDPRLVAYVVAVEQFPLLGMSLRRLLQESLPAFMVPSSFVFLETFPLTPNGKIDRKSLPAPGIARPELETPYVAPRDPVERFICGLYGEVFGLDRVGADDDFFALGGDSLRAAACIARLDEVFSTRLRATVVFDAATPAGLAAVLRARFPDAAGAIQAPAKARPAVPSDRTGGYAPLSFAQRWFFHQERPTSPAFTMSMLVRMTGRLDVAVLERSLREIVRRHETLRTVFTTRNGEAMQQLAPPAEHTLERVHLGEVPPGEREARAIAQANALIGRPFDLARGPLFRTGLLELGSGDHLLVVAVHHLVWDGWSDGVLQRELAALYEAYSAGRASPLAPVPMQQATFAARQHERWMRGELDSSVAYWKRLFGGAPELLRPLAPDHPPAAGQNYYRPRTFRSTLEPDLLARLQQLSREERVTVFVVLFAVFQAFLRRRTGRDEITVGSGYANREQVELEGALGQYAQIWGLRTSLRGNPTFRELVRRIRRDTEETYEHPDFPPDLVLPSCPFPMPFQVVFNYFNYLLPLRLAGLTASVSTPPLLETSFQLHCMVAHLPDQIAIVWQHAADLFDEATIRNMAAELHELLSRAAADPDQHIDA